MSDTIQPTILFKRPDTIDGVVEFPLPDGGTAKLACKFKYRTRKEFGALWDEISKTSINDVRQDAEEKDAKKKPKASKEAEADGAKDEISFESIMQLGNKANAKNTLRYLAAWPEELPPLTEENLMQLFDEAQASTNAFWSTYRNLCTVGVAGN